MKWFLSLFRRSPKVWIVCDLFGLWHKVVCVGRPNMHQPGISTVIGPMRSETDAEESVDRMNLARVRKVRLHDPSLV